MSKSIQLKTINNEAFEFCRSLESVTIPGNVETIGRGAFAYCLNLKDITLGEGIKYIELLSSKNNYGVINSLKQHYDIFKKLGMKFGIQLINNNQPSLKEAESPNQR